MLELSNIASKSLDILELFFTTASFYHHVQTTPN